MNECNGVLQVAFRVTFIMTLGKTIKSKKFFINT